MKTFKEYRVSKKLNNMIFWDGSFASIRRPKQPPFPLWSSGFDDIREPHTGLSVVHHSKWSENEVLIHHGTKLEYLGTTRIKRKSDGVDTKIHRIIVHPEHLKLEDYGEYTINENF